MVLGGFRELLGDFGGVLRGSWGGFSGGFERILGWVLVNF